MKRLTVIFLVSIAFCDFAGAQLTGDALERRMAELNKRAATQPAVASAAQRGKYMKWRAKSNAPKEVKDWVAGFDVLRGVLITEIDGQLEKERQAGKREESRLSERLKDLEQDLAEIKSRNLTVTGYERDRRVGRQVFVEPVYDQRKVAKANADKKRVEEEMAPIKKRMGELKYGDYLSEDGRKLAAQKKKITNPSEIPIATLALVPGRVGYLGMVKVAYVSDERSFMAQWRNETVWIEGLSTSGLKSGLEKKIEIPMRVVGTKSTGNIASKTREVYALQPFEYEPYVEQVESDAPLTPVVVSASDARGFASIAEMIGAVPKKLISAEPLGMTALQQEEFEDWKKANIHGQLLATEIVVIDVSRRGDAIIMRGSGTSNLASGHQLPYQINAHFDQRHRSALVGVRAGEPQRVKGTIRSLLVPAQGGLGGERAGTLMLELHECSATVTEEK